MNGRRIFAAVTVGHLGIDIFNAMGPVLLVFLKAPLGLGAAQIGLAVGLYQILAGATQPAFGWVVDRIGSRLMGPLSVACNLACIGLAVTAARTTGSFALFLLPFALAAVASGAFHPLGVMHASTANLSRSATFMAIFFLSGHVGLATGPVLAGAALDRAGLMGIYWLLLAVAPVPVFMAVAMGPRRFHSAPGAVSAEVEAGAAVAPELPRSQPVRVGAIGLLALVIATRSWAVLGTAAFLPLLLSQQGWSAKGQGLAAGLFLVSGALMSVLAGAWADRWGRRPVVFLTTLLGSLLLVALPGSGDWAIIVAFACGTLLGAPHSVLMVIAQSVLPWGRGMASGMGLGFLFASGGVSAWAIGLLADRFELATVLQAGALVGLVSAVSALGLPRQRRTRLAVAPAVSATLVVLVLGITVFAAPFPAAARLNGEINGQIRDATTGRPLPAAEIRISGDQLQQPQVVRSDSGGSFRAPGLPPGVYDVEASVDGFVTSAVENLRLVVGGVLRVDFRLRSGSESMLDLVSSPLLDVVTGSDGNVLPGADLRELPGSEVAVHLDLAVGLDAVDSEFSVNGWPPAFANYRLDGQDRVLHGPGASAVDPHWVDQVRVRSMDFGAQMAGPHIDLITRSGGTTWQFDANASVTEPLDRGARPALLLVDAENRPAGGVDREQVDGREVTAFAGGPLRDKRARAFGAYTNRRFGASTDLFGAGTPLERDEETERTVGKLDWWAGSASNLTLKHQTATREMTGRRPPGFLLPASAGTERQGSSEQTTSLNVEWGLTDRLWLRAFGGRSDEHDSGEAWLDAGLYFLAPEALPDGVPQRRAPLPAGWYEPSLPGRLERSAARRSWAVEPSLFLFDHTFEVGIQSSRSRIGLARQGHPGRSLAIPGGGLSLWSGQPLRATSLRQQERAVYVQDAWRLGGVFDRQVTLHLGLRAEEESTGPLRFGFEDRTEPRLAFVWDVAGRGRWKVYGGAAWFHVDTFRPIAGLPGIDASADLLATSTVGPTWSGSGLLFGQAEVDPDLRAARVREIQFGTRYQFLPDVVISARLARRRLVDGVRLLPLGVGDDTTPVLLSPGRGAGVRPWGEDGPLLPRLEQDWWGAELNANVGFHPAWRVHVSYLLSRLTGNHEAGGLGLLSGGAAETHPAVTTLDLCSSPVPCDVFDVTSSSRRLALDREHQFSSWFVLSPGEHVTMALVYRFRTGQAYVPRSLVARVDEASRRILSTGLAPVARDRDAPHKAADLKHADLSLTYRIPLRADDRSLSVFAEALNVFDQDAATVLWPLTRLDPASLGLVDADLASVAAVQGLRPDPRAARPASYQDRRKFRAGIRLQF